MNVEEKLSSLGVSKVVFEHFDDMRDMYRSWAKVITYKLDMTKRFVDFIAEILLVRHELKQQITDVEFLNEYCVNKDVKAKIRERLGMSTNLFNVNWSELKKKGFITENGQINGKYVMDPNEAGTFKMIYVFKMK